MVIVAVHVGPQPEVAGPQAAYLGARQVSGAVLPKPCPPVLHEGPLLHPVVLPPLQVTEEVADQLPIFEVPEGHEVPFTLQTFPTTPAQFLPIQA